VAPKAKKTGESGDASETVDAIPSTATSKLRKLTVQNFGCIGNTPVEVELDDIVVLVGPNNAGTRPGEARPGNGPHPEGAPRAASQSRRRATTALHQRLAKRQEESAGTPNYA